MLIRTWLPQTSPPMLDYFILACFKIFLVLQEFRASNSQFCLRCMVLTRKYSKVRSLCQNRPRWPQTGRRIGYSRSSESILAYPIDFDFVVLRLFLFLSTLKKIWLIIINLRKPAVVQPVTYSVKELWSSLKKSGLLVKFKFKFIWLEAPTRHSSRSLLRYSNWQAISSFKSRKFRRFSSFLLFVLK